MVLFSQTPLQAQIFHIVYDISGVMSILFSVLTLYLLFNTKKLSKVYLYLQVAIVCVSSFCDFLLCLSQPVILMPYLAFTSTSPFRWVQLNITMAKTLTGLYICGELLLVYLLTATLHSRIYFLKRGEVERKVFSWGFTLATTFIMSLSIFGFILVEGVPLYDLDMIQNESISVYGSGVYKLLMIIGEFGFQLLGIDDKNNDSIMEGKIPAELLLYMQFTPSTYYWVTPNSWTSRGGTLVILLLTVFVIEEAYIVIYILYLIRKLKSKIHSKQARQAQIGFVRILLMQVEYMVFVIFYIAPVILLSTKIMGSDLLPDLLPSLATLYVSWHSTGNCLILIFGSKPLRGVLVTKCLPHWLRVKIKITFSEPSQTLGSMYQQNSTGQRLRKCKLTETRKKCLRDGWTRLRNILKFVI